ncbi:MAG: helix-turn-helix transcriptional regulator [Saprospiraceae bacterium]|uniref:Helix-turn-helix transcriptional regulator n=1 Tax=Candidatus Opimibacter skivensis TaxID=2982028 RepID=A0A9D7SWQ8_9BACT|nr:helix-turn-helix transcriptional regulator [Candidatus Opimibacter skivensis]
MINSKAHLYAPADQIISTYANGIKHPTRVVTLRDLRDFGPMTVLDLAEHHPLSLSAYSQHIEILRDIQLIKFKKNTLIWFMNWIGKYIMKPLNL